MRKTHKTGLIFQIAIIRWFLFSAFSCKPHTSQNHIDHEMMIQVSASELYMSGFAAIPINLTLMAALPINLKYFR